MAGGTLFTAIFTLIAVFSQPQGEVKHPILAFYLGRVPVRGAIPKRSGSRPDSAMQ